MHWVGWGRLGDLFDSLPTGDAPRRVSAICHHEALDGDGFWSQVEHHLCWEPSTGREHVLLAARWITGGAEELPTSLLTDILLHPGKRVGDCLLSSWEAVKSRMNLVHKLHMPCVYFSTQVWPNTGLKLFLCSLLLQLGTADTDKH